MRKLINKYRKFIPLLDQALVSGGNFLIGIFLTRALGLQLYGEFALLWLIILFASSIQQAGILNPMYTFSPQMTKEKKKVYLKNLYCLQLIYAVISASISLLFLRLKTVIAPSWEISHSSYWLAFTLFTFLVHDFIRKLNYAKEKSIKSFLLDLCVYTIQLGGIVVLNLSHHLNLENALIVIAFGFSMSFLWSIPEFISLFKTNISLLPIIHKHWNFSKWLIGTSLLQWFSGNFYVIAAATLLSPMAVGAIRIIQNIIGLLHVLFLAFENIVPLSASKIFMEKGIVPMGRYLRRMMAKGVIGTIFIGGIIALFGKEIMHLLYNGEHTQFAYLLYGFAALYILVFIGTIIRFAIRTLEKTNIIFISYVVSSVISLILAKPIINTLGIDGVIVGLVLSQVIIQACFIYALRNNLREICGLSISY